MYFYQSKLNFFVILIVWALLNACTTGGHYAPVKTDNNESSGDKQNLLISKRRLIKGSQVVTRDTETLQTASNRRNFRSMDLSSGHGYQRLVSRNQKSPAYNLTTGIKHSDPQEKGTDMKQQNTALKSVSARQTKTNNSLTNKSNSEERNAHKKQPSKPGIAQQQESQQKKSIVSIDNKKMLELNFGWPIKGRVLKSFSPPRNKGIDIAGGKNGQPVKATEAGKVVYGGQGLIGFGKLLVIRHNDVYLSAYANNSRLLVNEGQLVQKGQVVAKVGDVGIKRTSLHFEIRENGKPVNPLNFLPKK